MFFNLLYKGRGRIAYGFLIRSKNVTRFVQLLRIVLLSKTYPVVNFTATG